MSSSPATSISGSTSSSGGTDYLGLLRAARTRLCAIIYAARLHSLHSTSNPVSSLFNIALPRVKVLKELDHGSAFIPIQILVVLVRDGKETLYEKWDISIEQHLYRNNSVLQSVLNRRLMVLMRVVMGFLRSMPAQRLYQDHTKTFTAEGKDLFDLRLISQPSGTNLFGQTRTKNMQFTTIVSEAGSLRISVTWAEEPEVSLIPLPNRPDGDKSSNPASPSTPMNIAKPTTSSSGGLTVGSPSPINFIQDDYQAQGPSQRRPTLSSSDRDRSPYMTPMKNPTEPLGMKPSAPTNIPILSNNSRSSPTEADRLSGRSLPMDIPNALRNSQTLPRPLNSRSPESNLNKISKSPVAASPMHNRPIQPSPYGYQTSPTYDQRPSSPYGEKQASPYDGATSKMSSSYEGASSVPSSSDIGMRAVIRQRRESSATKIDQGSLEKSSIMRTSSGKDVKMGAGVGSPSSSTQLEEFSMGTPKFSSVDSMRQGKGPSPPKFSSGSGSRISPAGVPIPSPARLSGAMNPSPPHPELARSPPATAFGSSLVNYDVSNSIGFKKFGSTGSSTSMSASTGTAPDLTNSYRIDEDSDEDAPHEPFAMEPHKVRNVSSLRPFTSKLTVAEEAETDLDVVSSASAAVFEGANLFSSNPFSDSLSDQHKQ